MKGAAWGIRPPQHVSPVRPALGKGVKGAVKGPPVPQPTSPDTSIIVYSTADHDEVGIRTLAGEYKEEGTNHGRKVFRKMTKTGPEAVDVYMYYWDERDGPVFAGWWFGNMVGGDQVWSRNNQKTVQPPASGWTIPWDGEIKKELVVYTVTSQQTAQQAAMQGQPQQQWGQQQNGAQAQKEPEEPPKTWEERVQYATERAAECQIDAEEALEQAKAAMEGELDEEAVKAAQFELGKLAPMLGEVQRFLASEGLAAQKAPPELKSEMMMVGQRVRKLQAEVRDEANRLKNAKAIKAKEAEEEEKKAEQELREKEMEGQHQKQFEEMVPPAMEKVDVAEDEVEKVAIAAAPLQIEQSDEIRPVMLQAIKDTETQVRTAQAAIGEARRFITGKISIVQRFASSVKTAAIEEFEGLQAKINDAQEKLNPYKTIRQDYESRVQAKQMLEELNAKLAGAEIEVEKAAMMTAPLGTDSTEAIKETESSLGSAQSALSQAARLIDSKMKGLEKQKGAVFDDVKVLQDRANSAQEKLDEVRKDLKEQQVRVAANQLLKEVSEKVSNAEDELQKMCDAELPFMKGDPKGQELDALIEEADTIAAKVHSAITEAQSFVAKKLVEVARFSEGQAKVVKEDLDGLQKRLDDCRSRLQQFKVGSADRKRTHLLQEVEERVTSAEAEVQRMSEAAAFLSNIGTTGEAAPDALKESLEQANAAERSASAGIVVARKALLQKTAELKQLAIAGLTGAGAGSELGKFQSRVNTMHTEMQKLQKSTKEAEEKMLVRQMLTEVVKALEASELEVDKVVDSAPPLKAGESLPADQIEGLDQAASSVHAKLTATANLIDIKLKNAQGFQKDELQNMKMRVKTSEGKLSGLLKATADQKHKMQSAEILARATEMVEKAEAQVEKGQEAELPFLKGIEVLHTKEASDSIKACEAAASNGLETIGEARNYISLKMVDIKANFSQAAKTACTKALTEMSKRLDAGASKLQVLVKDTTERKRKSQMQESVEKIQEVETALLKLENAIAKFADDKLADLGAEDARNLCEEISKAEMYAQTSVSNSKKFLADRTAEVKTYAEGLRGPMVAELAKLQTRLTQGQVELAKLSKQCTEREQTYVARKLIQDTTSSLDKLAEEIDNANKVATPLLADDTSELLAGMYVHTFTEALQSYMKTSGISTKDLFSKVSKKKSASAEEFKAFLDKIVELTGNYDMTLSEEQAAIIFKRVASKPSDMTFADFNALFKECYICTYSVPLTTMMNGSEEVTTVEAGEAMEVLSTKTDKDGGLHLQCALTRDGTSGWAAFKASDGAANFKVSLAGAPQFESIFAYVSAIHSKCVEAAEYIEQKTTEVSGVKTGPLSEVKAKLLQLRMKCSQEQAKADDVKNKASAGHEKIMGKFKDDIQKTLEIRCKAFADRTMKEARQALEAAEKKASGVMELAKAGYEGKSMAELEKIRTAYLEAVESLVGAKTVVASIQEKHAAFRGTRPILLESRVELTKLKSLADTQEKRLAQATKGPRDAFEKHLKEQCSKTRSAIRSAARKAKQTSQDAFTKAAGGKAELTQAQFVSYVEKLPDHGIDKKAITLLFKETKPSTWIDFSKLVQEYTVCDKGVAITDSFDIASSNTIRKLMERELWEILEGPKEDPESKVPRVRGRALRDGATGWVSVKGNQGSQFLKAAPKPFLSCIKEADMRVQFDPLSALVRPVKVGEVLEIIEGPREEDVKSEQFLQGTCGKSKGWITLKTAEGVVSASKCKDFYVCKSLIAMTDVFDLASCKVLKKVEVGDVLQVMAGEKSKEDATHCSRLQFKSPVDGKEGWVTLKGNQGTVYMELSSKHYRLDKETKLRTGPAKESAVIKTLKAGEAFEAPDPALEERPPAKVGALARAVEDGAEGWLLWHATSAPVKPFTKKA